MAKAKEKRPNLDLQEFDWIKRIRKGKRRDDTMELLGDKGGDGVKKRRKRKRKARKRTGLVKEGAVQKRMIGGVSFGGAKRRERRVRLGLAPAVPEPDVTFARGDVDRALLESNGGIQVDEQGSPRKRRKRRRGLGKFVEPKGLGDNTGPVPDQDMDGERIFPRELLDEGKRKKVTDALASLFGLDLAQLPAEAAAFAVAEVGKMQVGERVDPAHLQEVYRVCSSAAILLDASNVTKREGDKYPLQVSKFDDELQIVWGEVYIPGLPDSQGDFMTEREVQKMAWAFLAAGRVDQVDRMHDQENCGAVVVESFIARKGDPDFIEGAWVAAVHIPDQEIWSCVKRGEFNGFSMEGMASRTEKQFELDLPEEIRGRTSGGGTRNHEHDFVVRFSDQGEFLGGQALPGPGDAAHPHDIMKGSVTEPHDDHVHRYSFAEAILEVSTGRRPPNLDEVGQVGF